MRNIFKTNKNTIEDVRIARLAQSVERKTLNLTVVGSSPTLGEIFSIAICALVQFRIDFYIARKQSLKQRLPMCEVHFLVLEDEPESGYLIIIKMISVADIIFHSRCNVERII